MNRWSNVVVNAATILLVALLLIPTVALGQRLDGDLRGVVKDPTGAVIPEAAVTITNQDTGEVRNLKTTRAGVYFASNLLPGSYMIRVEVSGFRTVERTSVVVISNRIVEANFSLEVGPTVEVVTVEEGAELVTTQSSTLVGVSHSKYELSGPGSMGAIAGANAGNPIALAAYAPGTTTQPGGMAGQGGSIGGNRPRMNSFTVDGLDNNDPSVTGQNGPVLAEAIREFTLITNQFAAEYGHSTAAQFVVTTDAGTNEIHGKGWWYHQNRNYNAFDNLTRAATPPGEDKPRYDVNRFGGAAGGSIIKDKLFYYGAYEYQIFNQAGTPSGRIEVPTDAGLSALMGLAGVAGSGVSSANVGILQSWVPTASTQAVDSGGVPIAYDVCDETANPTCDPLGAVVSIPVGVFAASTPQFQKHHRYIISSDFQTGGHKVSGRFHFNRQRSIVAGALPVEQFNSTNALDSRRLTLTDVWSVTPNVVNELRFGWMRRTGPNLDVRDTPAPAGTDVFGNYTIDEMSLGIGPQSNLPQGQAGNTYQLANNLTWVKGRHILKLGFDVRNIIRGGGFLPRARGDYAWTADTTAALGVLPVLSGLDGFVRDVFPNRVSIRGVGSGFFAQNRTAFYAFVQDSWRIHPRVTLDFGFRYEYTETARDSARQVENGLSNIGSITGEVYTPELLLATGQGGAGCVDLAGCELDPLNGTPIFDNLSTAHQQVLLSHIGTSLIFKAPEADLDNIAPRLGLSWDLFGDGSTSLRAGVGRGFDVLFGNLPLLQLPPQAQAENREGNACFLSPSPGWCINTDGGEPLNPSGLSDIRHNTTGFLASGGLLPVLPLDTTFDPIIARAATGAFVLDDDPLPETWTWTLSLQRELFGDFMVEARYVGTHAIHLFVQRHPNTGVPVYFNQPSLRLPVFTSTSQVPGSFAAGDPTLAAFDLARATGTSSSRMLSPYGFRGAMTEFSPIANSSYHGASAILRKRLSTEEWGGLMFNFNWTWSKTIDNIENDLFTSLLNPRRPFNHTDVSIQRGLSGMHRAHKVGLTWFYELPRWEGDSGAMNKLMNGWQFSGTYLYETGQPVTVIAFRDIDGNADFSALDFVYRNISGTAGVGTDSSAVCWDGALVSGFTGAAGGATCVGDTVGYVADTDNAEWIIPGRGGWTNSGRGNHIMGEINNVNIEIAKETPFWGEGRYIRFAAQFVNLFNHPSFTIGTGSVFGLNTPAQTNLGFVLPGSTNFLQDDSFSGGLGNAPFSRVIQFSLKVVF